MKQEEIEEYITELLETREIYQKRIDWIDEHIKEVREILHKELK